MRDLNERCFLDKKEHKKLSPFFFHRYLGDLSPDSFFKKILQEVRKRSYRRKKKQKVTTLPTRSRVHKVQNICISFSHFFPLFFVLGISGISRVSERLLCFVGSLSSLLSPLFFHPVFRNPNQSSFLYPPSPPQKKGKKRVKVK